MFPQLALDGLIPIREAFRSGDREEARRSMLEHISTSRGEALDSFDQQESSKEILSTALQELPDDVLKELSHISSQSAT